MNKENVQDFLDGKVTEFPKDPTSDVWGTCRLSPDGDLGEEITSETSVSWHGEGIWTPAYFCFITRGSGENYASTCKPQDSDPKLNEGDEIKLECKHGRTWSNCDDDVNGWKAALP